jgi:hypothetical protein
MYKIRLLQMIGIKKLKIQESFQVVIIMNRHFILMKMMLLLKRTILVVLSIGIILDITMILLQILIVEFKL